MKLLNRIIVCIEKRAVDVKFVLLFSHGVWCEVAQVNFSPSTLQRVTRCMWQGKFHCGIFQAAGFQEGCFSVIGNQLAFSQCNRKPTAFSVLSQVADSLVAHVMFFLSNTI